MPAMPRNPNNPAYNLTVTAARKAGRRSRCDALLKDVRDYNVPLLMLAAAAGCSMPDLNRERMSEETLAALETAMFAIKMRSIPLSVMKTWEPRLKRIGFSRYWLMKRYGLSENTPYRMLEYVSGKRSPIRTNVEKIEAAVRKAEREFEEGTLNQGVVCRTRKLVKSPVASARKAGPSE